MMETQSTELRNAWERLCRDLQIEARQAALGFRLIGVRYGETHRAYHTLAHVRDCLEQFESLRCLCPNPFAVELAIWFHDLVYETTQGGNEEASVAMLRQFGVVAKIETNLLETACACVLATKHEALPKTDDECVMIDVDLSILGRSWEAYAVYTRQIRTEYNHILDPQFVLGRRQVMQSFLNRERLFSTAPFYARYEARARANITHELEELKIL